jgi:phospholipid-binding lipoprotein MlaA
MNILRCKAICRSGLISAILLCLLSGCSTMKTKSDAEIPAKLTVSENVKDDVVYKVDVYDPMEGMNRRIYKFNALFDNYVYLPVVSGYEFITPDPVEKGVTNFFNNLREVQNLLNTMLQLKIKPFGSTVARVLINTTAGVAGFFDVATYFDIYRAEEDFGQTLGHYGVGNGPFLVLPFLGPSNLRDTGGFMVDAVGHSLARTAIIDSFDMKTGEEDKLNAGLSLLEAIDLRHNMSFRYYMTGSPFEYELIRLLYTQKRDFDIKK